MGAVYTPICGQVLCGQTNVSLWKAVESRPKLVLNPRTFSITITEGPLITLVVNRPKLILGARAFVLATESSPSFNKPQLVLKARAFTIAPFIGMRFPNRPQLILRARAFTIGLSASLPFGRPKLILNAGRIRRVGRRGLIPTVPEEVTLTPAPVTDVPLLTPTAAESELLTPTTVAVR